MKMFYKIRYNVVLMVVLALLMQVVGPVIGDYVYAGDSGGFEVDSTINEDGSATVRWTYEYVQDGGLEYSLPVGFILTEDEEKSGELTVEEVVIGQYTILKDGGMTVKFDENAIKKSIVAEPEEVSVPLIPLEVSTPIEDEQDEEVEDKDVEEIDGEEENLDQLPGEDEGDTNTEEEEEDSARIIEELLDLLSRNTVYAEGNDEEIEEYTFSGSFKIDGVVEDYELEEDDPVKFGKVDLEHIDINGNKVEGGFKVDSRVSIKFNYTIEDKKNVDLNKIYEFKIPKEIKIIDKLEFKLIHKIKDDENVIEREIADVVVEEDGSMTVQFIEEVNNPDYDYDRSGFIEVETQYDEKELGTGGKKTIKFEVNGETKEYNVGFETIEPSLDVELEKSGNWNPNTNIITWTIKVIPKVEPSYLKDRKITNLVIKDILQDDTNGKGRQNYVADSVSIKKGNENFTGGTFTDSTAHDNTLSYAFPSPLAVNNGDEYTITFKTKPDISAFEGLENGKWVVFKNQATGTFEEKEEPVTSKEKEVKQKVNLIEKKGRPVPGDSSTKHRIDWEITINSNNLTIENAKIEDLIPEGLALDEESIKLDGKKLIIGEENNIDSKIVKVSSLAANNDTKLTVELGKIERKHVLKYSTIIVDEDAYKENDGKTYTNKAWLYNGEEKLGYVEEGKGIGIVKGLIDKSGSGYNYKDNEITWRIQVNKFKETIDGAIVTDIITDPNQEFVGGSVKINGANPTVGQFTYAPGNGDTKPTLTFNLGDIENTVTIEFKTKAINTKEWLEQNESGGGSHTFENKAILKGKIKDKDIIATDEGNETVKTFLIKKKALSFDYTTNTVKWEVKVNENGMALKNVRVEDIITDDNQEFVEGSVMIKDIANPVKKDSTDQLISRGDYHFDKDGKKLTVYLGDITGKETITFETKIPEDKLFEFFKENANKSLENKATIYSNEIKEDGLTAKGSIGVKSVVVDKDTNYKKGDSIDWEVIINKNQLTLKDVTLVDILQEGLLLDISTVELKNIIIDNNGNYIEGESAEITTKYSPQLGGRTIEFKILGKGEDNEITDAYILKFTTDIENDYKDEKFKNTITLKGSSIEQEDVSKIITASWQSGGGGATGTSRGSITILKVDSEDTTKILEGAKIQLLDKDGKFVEEKITKEDGKIKFEKLFLNQEYTIKESVAPDGYVLGLEPYKFTLKKGFDTEGSDKKHLTLEIKNKKVEKNIKLKKVEVIDGEKVGLSGAIFGLYHKTDTELRDVLQTKESDVNGIVEFENVPYGDYIIAEIAPPEGYKPSSNYKNIEIFENDFITDGEIDLTLEEGNDIVNEKIKGNIAIIKKGEGDNLLPGARFGLFENSEAEDPIGNLFGKTDNAGYLVFENVPYGSYFIKEMEPPTGYLISDTRLPQKVIINESNDNQLQEFTFSNTRIRGDIKLLKQDKYGNLLSGAEFALYDSENELLERITSNSQGIVLFEEVEFGDYTIKEIKSPSGYKLENTKVYNVSIEEDGVTVDKDMDGKDLVVVNLELGRIKIFKVDSRNESRLLPGAIFEVRDSSGNLVEEVTTDTNGFAMVKDLEYGEYTIVEIRAPGGYRLNSTEHLVKVNGEEDGYNIEVSLIVKNTRRPTGPGPRDPDPKDPVVPPVDPEDPEPTDPIDPPVVEPEDPDPTDPTDPVDPEEPVTPEEPPTTIVTDPPSKGTVTIDEDGNWTYVPKPGATGKDYFTLVHPDGREELIEIDLDDLPLGTTGVKNGQPVLPKTGAGSNLGFYMSGLLLIGLGIFLRKRIV